jgi:wobble nucleotide-excising tRNase
MSKKIKIKIGCENLAPLDKLDETIDCESLKIAIYADNGSGKSFITRAFNIASKDSKEIDISTSFDKFIAFNKNKCQFSFKVTDKDGKLLENFCIDINKGCIPTKPDTYYNYHCFNQDYVDSNIKRFSYDKDSNIIGFILGKVNIDLSTEKESLFSKLVQRESLLRTLESQTNDWVFNKIGSIPNINRLNEYRLLTHLKVIESIRNPFEDVTKSYFDLLSDYNKIKSVPENLEDINDIPPLNIDLDLYTNIEAALSKVFSLSSLADKFKDRIKSKQNFIETGLSLITEKNECPFCEQSLNEPAIELIDTYTAFLQNEEASALKLLNQYKEALRIHLRLIKAYSEEANKRIIKFNEYKTNYIVSQQDVELDIISLELITNYLAALAFKIDDKAKNISQSVALDTLSLKEIENEIKHIIKIGSENNNKIKVLNSKKNGIDAENKSIRRDLCKAVFNDLILMNCSQVEDLKKLEAEIKELEDDIKSKEEQQKVSKKDKVLSTIKRILTYFFGDKYSLDDETFRLTLNRKILDVGQAKDVLSDGEKNVIAFAYFIGDIHLKVEKEDDYNNLFFIIDDPISSMDFNHVYSISGIIRSLKDIINIKRERFIIFTHNLDFMRVLVGNNIVSKSMILKNSKLKEFNNNITVPYINHLHDIYRVAKQKADPTHTTGNSIRHIIETLNKFENCDSSSDLISKYIEDNIPQDSKSYTLINDLSHGGWRSEQAPIHQDDYVSMCQSIVDLIERKYKGQVEYCEKLN